MATPSIGLDITEFERSWREMLDRMEKLPPHVQRASRALTMLRSVFSSLGVGLGIGGLVAFTKSVLNFARETSDAAKTAGVLPETLQRIQAALSRKLSADDATAALVSLNHALRDAKSGSVDAQDKLAQLGVTFNDIKTKTPDEILLQLADHVKDAIDPVEALREVSNLFGADLASKLTPALQGGSSAMKEIGDSASVASDQMIESAASGARALERLGKVAKQTALEAVDFWSRVRFTMNGPVPSFSLKGRGGSVAKTPHTIDVEARASAAKAAADKTGDAGNKNAKQISANNADQLTAEKKLLSVQSAIALQIAPEYVKQSEILTAEYERLNTELTSARGLERDKLTLQIAQNAAAQWRLQLDQKARVSEITLNTTKAKLGESFNDRQKGFLAEIRDIDNQIYIARFKGDKQAVAALMLRRRDKAAEAIDDQFDHQSEISSLRIQTSEVIAQSKGLKSVAEQARIIAQYDTEIAKQKKAQNVEAVKLLETQKAIAQRDADAAQHDETPADRRKARHNNQVLNRKAKQQRERNVAALRGRNGGLASGGLNVGARGFGLRTGGLNDPSVSFQAQEARAKLQLSQQGAQMQVAAYKAVMDIARAVTSDK